MDLDIKGEPRNWKQSRRRSILSTISKCRGVRSSILLCYAALICLALGLHYHFWHSPLYDAVASLLEQKDVNKVVHCGRQLSNQVKPCPEF